MKNPTPYIVLAFIVGAIAGAFGVQYAVGTKLVVEQVPATSATDTAQTAPAQVPSSTTAADAVPPTCQALTVLEPQADADASSPLNVSVIVDNRDPDCHWTVFEAQAGSAVLQDPSGNVLGTAPLKTAGDWTSNEPLEYDATVALAQSYKGIASLTITEEDPSGKPNPRTVSVGVNLK